MQIQIALVVLFSIISVNLCRVLPENESEIKVIIPDQLTPKKDAFFLQRQVIILLVPTAGLNGFNGLGGINGGLPIGGINGGLPVGGLPGGGFNARNRNIERLRALRRRTRIRPQTRSTTPSYETMDEDN